MLDQGEKQTPDLIDKKKIHNHLPSGLKSRRLQPTEPSNSQIK
jgi:hypothetical protein